MSLEKFADVRQLEWNQPQLVSGNITESVLATLEFNALTDFSHANITSETTPGQFLELGKNPGLGVRSLNTRGITGKGVVAAIIDQPIFFDHPEFTGKIINYHTLDPEHQGSMHGPAVTSLFVGATVGIAPDTRLYYAASPTYYGKESDEVDSLLWLIEQNKLLPADQKIRVVSVSAAPTSREHRATSGSGWSEAVTLANQEGILVLDCTSELNIIGPGYSDYHNPDDPASFTPGYPNVNNHNFSRNLIHAPVSPRTYAEQYKEGEYGYTYSGSGGLSWAIPYAAGVLCLGWQIAPNFTYKQMLKILFDTAYIKEGVKIINPVAFIEKLERYPQGVPPPL